MLPRNRVREHKIDVQSTWTKGARLKDLSCFLLLAAVATANALLQFTDHGVFQRVGSGLKLLSPEKPRRSVVNVVRVHRGVSTFDLSFVTSVMHQTNFSSCVILILF